LTNPIVYGILLTIWFFERTAYSPEAERFLLKAGIKS